MSKKRSPGWRAFKIGVDQGFDGVGDFVFGESRADDVADRSGFVAGAAKSDLVKFDALLIDAENADMADMVVAAGVDAARDFQLQLADVALAVEVGEAFARRLARC